MNGDATEKELYDKINELELQISVVKTLQERHEVYTEKALDKTEKQLLIRLETMNEFRGQLSDQSKTFLTQIVYEANHKLLETKIEALQKIAYTGLGIVTVLVFVIPIILHFIP